MKLTYLGLPYEGKEDPSDLELGHPALAPGDTPNGLLLHATAYPGLALEEDASDGLGEAGKVVLEVGQLCGVDLVWAMLVVVPLCLGLLYSLLYFPMGVLYKLIVVDLSVAVHVCLLDHPAHLIVRQILAPACPHLLQLVSRDEAVAVLHGGRT